MGDASKRPLGFCILFFAMCVLLSILPSPAQALEKTYTNSVGMEFVLIPPGTFQMGTPPDEPYRGRNELMHQVTITKPFYMQTTEVTVKQWRAIMGRKFFARKKGTSHMPVVRVSWKDCMEFIEKLNDREKGTYRLPTEAEWEYACRAGTTTAYSWGDTIDCSKAMYSNNTLKSEDCVKDVEERGLPSDQPAPVKSYQPNAWGLYDMSGNVWEWCQDWFGDYPADAVKDPQGPDDGTEKARRGGSWYKFGYSCRCGNRNISHPANRYHTTGFRVVKEVP